MCLAKAGLFLCKIKKSFGKNAEGDERNNIEAVRRIQGKTIAGTRQTGAKNTKRKNNGNGLRKSYPPEKSGSVWMIPRRRRNVGASGKKSQGRAAYIYPWLCLPACAMLHGAAGNIKFPGAAPPMSGRRGRADQINETKGTGSDAVETRECNQCGKKVYCSDVCAGDAHRKQKRKSINKRRGRM